jgi:hypothetical protein
MCTLQGAQTNNASICPNHVCTCFFLAFANVTNIIKVFTSNTDVERPTELVVQEFSPPGHLLKASYVFMSSCPQAIILTIPKLELL